MTARARGVSLTTVSAMIRTRPFFHGPVWWVLALASIAAVAAPAGPAVAPVVAAGQAFSWTRFLAPFHMVVLHFPIGVVSMAALLEVWNWRKPSAELRRVVQFALTVAVLASMATMAFGFLRAEGGDYDPITLARHRGWGIAAGAVTAIAWGLHRLLLGEPRRGGIVAFRLLLFVALMCLVIAGHHGGSLTHGTTFLTENAPNAIKNLLAESPETPAVPGSPAASSSREATEAKAVFAHRCIACHGPEKQKGKFRVDDREMLLHGGKSGIAAVVPGDPGKSNLIRLCTLPKDNDDAMPPEGFFPLDAQELMALVKWIQAGAPF